MFVGKTSQLEFAGFLAPELKKIIASVLDRLETPLENGRHEIEGANAYFMLVNDHTQLLEQRKSECHSRYLDVQILLEGNESFGYSLTPYKGLDEDMLAEKDLAFSEQMDVEHFAKLTAGEFIVFYPGQPHRPLVAVDDKPMPVRKVVIKVDKALFA
ncbi:YhcH/YjgK/YiaL family protein [Vibrio ziniensis]|uniref:DUF386 family protein n=1 Tax=Vibrio ziniensis TaxID=2711221 RepID=A0A6G7CM72_9VIBR|nr:YhcH/YjgK/YiaL family protein [Vibrio ziniensis]QIH43202.1 DUF386 family protein [Vibrio ziniensis]